MNIFSNDCITEKELIITPGAPIENPVRVIKADEVGEEAVKKGDAFAQEIEDRFVANFEREGDKMAHVSTFVEPQASEIAFEFVAFRIIGL